MKFFLRLFAFLAVCCFVCLSAVPARADSVYNITGVLTIVGNDVCGGVPCVETLAFSFDVTWIPQMAGPGEYIPGEYNPVILPGSQTASFGPLGTFALRSGEIPENYMQFFDYQGGFAGNEIDIDVDNAPVAFSPQPLQLGGAYLYGCETNTCITDFVSSPDSFAPGQALGIFLGGFLQYNETAVPEASTLWYLLIGVGLILLTVAVRRRKTMGERADVLTSA